MDISDVVKKEMCTGCGTCYSACPNDCISIVENTAKGIYQAKIAEENCESCGTCHDVCPQTDIQARAGISSDKFIGNVIYSFAGYSLDSKLRYSSSSGGLITALSLFSLRSGYADAVISVGPSQTNPLRYEVKMCRTEEEVVDCKGSKYCPVSLNKVLKDIVQKNNNERYLYIGLPCHLWGLKKFISAFPEAASRIKYTFGLFCGHVSNFKGTEFILKKWRIPENEIKRLDYRGDGWPGMMRIKAIKDVTIPLPTYWGQYFGNYYFSPLYCHLCHDLYAVDSDISFGDAWLEEYREDKIGRSIGIVRTEAGRSLLEDCREKGQIFYEFVEKEQIEKIQIRNSTYKNLSLEHRIFSLLNIPAKSAIPRKLKAYNRLLLLNSRLSKCRLFNRFLFFLSGKLEKLFFKSMSKIKIYLLK